ncbi:hypothetical protein SDC9_140026 [bioreactor metagenome]|uniref:Uncharacterized protein n=1 Tax=bioreactor metagenome TaxID=1076179 RepID=A0A645DTS2_9ZZZZ
MKLLTALYVLAAAALFSGCEPKTTTPAPKATTPDQPAPGGAGTDVPAPGSGGQTRP